MQAMKHAKPRPPATPAKTPANVPAKTPADAKTATGKTVFVPPAGKIANPRLQADARWQRTQRYGWDKGGSRGGRK